MGNPMHAFTNEDTTFSDSFVHAKLLNTSRVPKMVQIKCLWSPREPIKRG